MESNCILQRREITINIPEAGVDATAWYIIAKILKDCIDFIHDTIESSPLAHFLVITVPLRRNNVLLVHCDLGTRTSYCVVLAYMMTKRRLRFKDALHHLKSVRPQLKLDKHTKFGLEAMERSLDARKLRRLEDRLRKAPIMSIEF